MGGWHRLAGFAFALLTVHAVGKPHPQKRRLQASALRGRELQNGSRTTWNDCKCKAVWRDTESGSVCNTTCCAFGDPYGDWCMVRDADCEESDWGYCKPAETVTIGACSDEPLNWVDVDGDSCGKYSAMKWCSPDGSYGSAWDEDDFGEFKEYAGTGGKTADKACCACGGGSKSGTHCGDDAAWEDKDGDDCATYAEFGWCNSTGHAGVGWHEDDWGTIVSYANAAGKSAIQACCACGGGSHVISPHNENNTIRYTLSGCVCKKVWDGCSTSCCPADGDPSPWCEVEDEDCEDSDWGYCRPEDWVAPRPGECVNQPTGWHDKAHYNCDDYEELEFCTKTGAVGTGWDQKEWGALKDWAPTSGVGIGKSALDVCCACGGGSKLGTPSYYEGCVDVVGWEDSDGDSCEDYTFNEYCTTDGHMGNGWHEEWGTFKDFTYRQRSADQACCSCGGGVRGGQQPPTQAPRAPSPSPSAGSSPSPNGTSNSSRYTLYGCKCKTTWQMESMKCTQTCCNPDEDEEGDWCMVEDEDCEEADWGYCRDERSHEALLHCDNSPVGWWDSEGDSCMTYVAEDWCTPGGETGERWDPSWGTPKDFAVDGVDAFGACCECGGGKPKDPTASNCVDIADWEDKDGDICEEYEQYRWCTADGAKGPGWHEDWGDFTGDPLPSKACCACGGGTRSGGDVGATAQVATGQVLATASVPADKPAETASLPDMKQGSASGVMLILLVIVIIAGAALGWYCYSTKTGGKDAEGLGAGTGVGKAYGKKYSTMQEGGDE